MIYKYTTCESVIAKILADSSIPEKDLRVTDMREWIFEAVEKIGAPMQYIHRESGIDCVPVMPVIDYQIPIPDDLERLEGVAWSLTPDGPYVPVRKDETTFKSSNRRHWYAHKRLHHDPKLPPVIVHPKTRAELLGTNVSSAIQSDYEHYKTDDVTYFVKPCWIVLNRPVGFVKLAYTAIATDERGYPLIPDMASYQEAVYWYVMMKLNFPKFMQGKLGGKVNLSQSVYYYLQQQWNFYRNQAYAEAMMPNEGEMMSIKNEWNKLVPDWDSDEDFFQSSGEHQLTHNDNYYGYRQQFSN